MKRSWLAAVALAGLAASCISAPRPPAAVPPRPLPPLPSAELSSPPLAEITAPAPLARRAPEVPGPSAEPRPILVRVGLASDLASFSLPCCQRSLVIEASAARTPLDEDLNVAPGSVGVASGSFRLQVAALRDEAAAAALAERLARRTGQPADSFYDAGVDLYRVRLGRYPGRPEAEAARRSLGADAAGAWLVEERSEGAGEAGFAFNLRRGGATESVPGRFLALASAGGEPIAYQGRRYRGRLVLFLNDRGGLNLINELPLEDYLRGVVPMEMGPEVYGRLEALKAQAVAARTYTLANLGQFAAEGFDLCASPRCQVYGGQSAEHPLSDRAVAETADQVLIYQGQPIEALYTASCGGHTEDVHVVFPAKNQAYLKGVPCEEAGAQTLASSLPPGSPFPYALAIELVPALAHKEGPAALEEALEELATRAAWPAPAGGLRSLERSEVARYLVAAFRLSPGAGDLDAWLVRQGWLPPLLAPTLTTLEMQEVVLLAAERLGLLTRLEGLFLGRRGRELRLLTPQEQALSLPSRLRAYRAEGGRRVAGDLNLAPGDRVRAYLAGSALVALVADVDPRRLPRDAAAPLSHWNRFKSETELAGRVRERYPELRFKSFEVLERGPSGRVSRLRLFGKGPSVDVSGLDVRFLFDLPETQFTVKKAKQGRAGHGWMFSGQGWGHGVGLCQTGSFGMAGRGALYRNILAYFYQGTELARVRKEPGVP